MPGFFNNIFGAFYYYYSNPKLKVSPRFGALMLVLLCQLLIMFLIFSLIKKITIFNAFLIFSKRIYLILLLIFWTVLLHFYYSTHRLKRIVTEFGEKNSRTKNLWNAVAIFSILIPLICTAFLLKK